MAVSAVEHRWGPRLAAGLWAVSLVGAVAGVAVLMTSIDVARPAGSWGPRGFGMIVGMAFATVGALIARRHPHNAVGWLYLANGLLLSYIGLADEWAQHTLLGDGRDLPLGEWAAWIANWAWILSIGASLVYAVLVFPDGRYPTMAARRIGLLSFPLLTIAALTQALADVPIQGFNSPNPVGVLDISAEDASSVLSLMMATVIAAQVVLVRRLRRSKGQEREQIRWVVTAEVFAGIALATNLLPTLTTLSATTVEVFEWVSVGGLLSIPIAAGFAILRHGLYGIETVVSRSVVFLGLTGFVSSVYFGLVAGAGALLQRSDEPNHLLSIGAAVIVALAFQPIRERLHRFADRVAFGRRAEPYEVLADLGEQLRLNQEPERLLGRLAESLTEGTGAAATTIWLRVLDELQPAATFPASALAAEPVAMAGGLDALPGDRTEPVEHDGELLGAITLTKRYSDPLPATADRLVGDVAAHAGLLLRNLRLTAELQRHIEELRESRQRLVAAQDAERRRLERDLHDGAQQQLVALKIHLNLARDAARDEGATQAAEMVDGVNRQLTEAIQTLRELAHGIYPPRLAADGLIAALEQHASRVGLPVRVTGDIGRYPSDVEAAVYFCCLEALQNVTKYADASTVAIELAEQDSTLVFVVTDDGTGFDVDHAEKGAGVTNMRDRIEALGGQLDIRSAAGAGTRVQGRVPLEATAARTSVALHV